MLSLGYLIEYSIHKINKVRGSFQIQFDVLISDYDCLTSSSSLLWLTLQCVVEFTGCSSHRYVGILPKKKKKIKTKAPTHQQQYNNLQTELATCKCEVSSPWHCQNVTSLCNVWYAQVTASCCTLNFKQKSSAAAILHHRGLHSTLTAYDRKTNQGWKSSRCEHQGPAIAVLHWYLSTPHSYLPVCRRGRLETICDSCAAESVWQNWSTMRHWCNVKCNIKINTLPAWANGWMPSLAVVIPLWMIPDFSGTTWAWADWGSGV